MKQMVTNIIFFLVVFLMAGGILLLAYFANQKFEEAAIDRSIAESELELALEELRANTKVLETLSNEIGNLNDKICVIGETVEAMYQEKNDEVEAADPIPAPTPIPLSVHIDFNSCDDGILVNGNIKITFDETRTNGNNMAFQQDIRMMKYYICNTSKARRVEFSIVCQEKLYGLQYNGRDYILEKSRAKAYRLAGHWYIVIAMPDEPWCSDDWQEECDHWLNMLDVECG